jgi:hypothetical protein
MNLNAAATTIWGKTGIAEEPALRRLPVAQKTMLNVAVVM